MRKLYQVRWTPTAALLTEHCIFSTVSAPPCARIGGGNSSKRCASTMQKGGEYLKAPVRGIFLYLLLFNAGWFRRHFGGAWEVYTWPVCNAPAWSDSSRVLGWRLASWGEPCGAQSFAGKSGSMCFRVLTQAHKQSRALFFFVCFILVHCPSSFTPDLM